MEEKAKRQIIDRLTMMLNQETLYSENLGEKIRAYTEDYNKEISAMTKRRAESEKEMANLKVLIAEVEKELLDPY